WLQKLIDDLEKSLQQAREALGSIIDNPDMPVTELATHQQTIDAETATIQKRLDRTREEAA
ncbi:MAG: hypothetical protein GWN87_30870, partial [Desulfuromonadales bacterium]|nr:hypothetical protein [Desulfuromonadales bacterium]NIS43964.1 hypothetical protein [Desulfuromonadales bacterium]